MPGDDIYYAVVVSSGPNGLAAAVKLVRNEGSVAVLETPGDHRQRQDMLQAQVKMNVQHHASARSVPHAMANTWPWVRGLTRPCNPRCPARNAGHCEDNSVI